MHLVLRGPWVVLTALLASVSALAHPSGVHERLIVTLQGKQLDILVTLDADSGAAAQRLRMGADLNGNGRLEDEEQSTLKRTTARRIREDLKVSISSYPVVFREEGHKLDLRKNWTRGQEGLSVAVLLRAELPKVPSDGMELVIEHRGRGTTHVVATVFVAGGMTPDGGAVVEEVTVEPGVPWGLRLYGLK